MKKYSLLLIAVICAFLSPLHAQITCEPNMDFETGTTAGWLMTGGHYTITTGSAMDSCYAFPIVGAGAYSLKLGDGSGTAGTTQAVRYIHVPATGPYSIEISRAVVTNTLPGTSPVHGPKLNISVYDSASATTFPPCGLWLYNGADASFLGARRYLHTEYLLYAMDEKPPRSGQVCRANYKNYL